MQKISITIIMLLILIVMTGCSDSDTEKLKQDNSFNYFSAQQTSNDYQIKGTAYLSSERDLVNINILADTEIILKGTFKKQEGEIKLLYEDKNGDITTLLNSQDTKEKTIKVDTSVSLKSGNGKFYLSGTSCIYDFDLKFGLNDNVEYSE